jgi:hypothetical protein
MRKFFSEKFTEGNISREKIEELRMKKIKRESGRASNKGGESPEEVYNG